MVDFSNIPAFDPDRQYRFSTHFFADEDGVIIRSFRQLLDQDSYDALAKFLTTNDDIPLYDNPAIAFQDEMEGEFDDIGIGDSGVPEEFMRFEVDLGGLEEPFLSEAQQIDLVERWKGFFEKHGFACGPLEEQILTCAEYDEKYGD